LSLISSISWIAAPTISPLRIAYVSPALRAYDGLFPDWWTFPLWAAFRGWYKATDPIRKQGFADHCAAGITREYMYKTFVKADPDPSG
jgi:hypothetical protein